MEPPSFPELARIFGLAAAALVASFACGAPSRPAQGPPARSAAADDDCGDIPDPDDSCPLLDGCAGEVDAGSSTADDGCPGPGGIPFLTSCDGKERRLAEIAGEIQRRPKLTTVRITSSIPGCADALRQGLARAGVARTRMETSTPPPREETRCVKWAYFAIASWDGARCPQRSLE